MQPIHDALEMLGDLNMGHEHRRSGDLMRSGSIVVEALSYIITERRKGLADRPEGPEEQDESAGLLSAIKRFFRLT